MFTLIFSGKKLNLSDFGHYFHVDGYFPANGEPDLGQYGTDVYSLSGMVTSNLALLIRYVQYLSGNSGQSSYYMINSMHLSLNVELNKYSEFQQSQNA